MPDCGTGCPPCRYSPCACEEAVNRQEKDEGAMCGVWDAECSDSGCTLERWHDGLCVDEYMVGVLPWAVWLSW